jgi:hypothetical protein
MPKLQDPFADTKRKFKENDLREIWQRMKATAIAQVQADLGRQAANNLAAQFNKGLGPLLDRWASQAGDLPKVSRSDLADTKDSIERVIESYRTGIQKTSIAGTKSAMILTGTLKGIKDELDRQVEWYHDVGLM